MKRIVDVYTADEVATALKLHPYTVRRLCREGKIPAFKFGWEWRFKKSDIEKWIKKQKQKRSRRFNLAKTR